MKFAKIVAVAAAIASFHACMAGTTADFVKQQCRKYNQDAVENAWNVNLAKAKAYATENKYPLIVVWSNGDACGHCVQWEKATNTSAFKNYVKSSGIVWVFGYPKDGHDGARNSGKIYKFAFKNQNQFPLIRIYWPAGKVDYFTKGDDLTGGTGNTAGANKAISKIKSVLKKYKYTPVSFTVDENGTMTDASIPANTAIANLALDTNTVVVSENLITDLPKVAAVTVPAGVTSIQAGALSRLSGCKKIYFEGGKPEIDETALSELAEDCVIFANPEKEGWSGTDEVNGIPVRTSVDVTFDANGGVFTDEDPETHADREVAVYAKLGEMPKVDRLGYKFAGWYTAKSGGSKVTEATVAKNDYTLFARWTAGWIVTLNPNGGTLSSTNKFTVAKSAAVGAIASPAKSGYKFAGWYTKKSGGSKINSKTKVKKNTTYYAHWTARKYKITVTKSGKGKVSGAGSKAYKSKVTLVAAPSSGYVFQGWYEKDGEGAENLLSRKAKYAFTVPLGGRTLIAKFISKTADKNGIGLEVGETGVGSLADPEAETPATALPALTNMCGVAFEPLSVATAGLTPTSVTVSGLPTGVKYNSSKKEIAGVPTAAKTYTVKITVKSTGASRAWSFKWVVQPLPAWARGTFTGTGLVDFDGENETEADATLTVDKTGKISGKFVADGVQYPFTAASFDGIDEDGALYVSNGKMTNLAGKAVEIRVSESESDAGGTAEVKVADDDGETTLAYAELAK